MSPLAVALKNLRPSTVENHVKHLQAFAKFLGFDGDVESALDDFFSGGRENGRRLFRAFQKSQETPDDEGKVISKGVIRNRLASVVNATRQNRRAARINWDLDSERLAERPEMRRPCLYAPNGSVDVAIKGLDKASTGRYVNQYRAYAKARGFGNDIDASLDDLLDGAYDRARRLVEAYLKEEKKRGIKDITIGLMATAFNRAFRQHRKAKRMDWDMVIDRPAYERGVSKVSLPDGEWRRLVSKAESEAKKYPGRMWHLALLHLLRTFRPGKVVALDLADVDLETGALRVDGLWLEIGEKACAELARCIEIRGEWPGPLFPNGKSIRGAGRLTVRGVWGIVSRLGQRAGLTASVNPEMLFKDDAVRRETPAINHKSDFILGESYRDNPIIRGDRMSWHYTPAQYDVLRRMIEYRDPGLTTKELRTEKHPFAETIIYDLIKKDKLRGPATRPVIKTPGGKGQDLFRAPNGSICPKSASKVGAH